MIILLFMNEKSPNQNPFEDQKKAVSNLKCFRIGVHSGKGGVGKTFVSVNLAYSLKNAGFSVGLLDADIDCPNVSTFLTVKVPAQKNGSSLSPILHNGVFFISTGSLNPTSENPIVIRGPIKHNMLYNFLVNTKWPSLDYLVIDLPPGTADVPLSAMQLSALDGLILVCAPTKESRIDTVRAANMAKSLNVPILGLIENFSGEIFGSIGKSLSADLGVPFLGSIPLSKSIADLSNESKIAFIEDPSLILVRENLIQLLALRGKK
jgi:ATP-binding protein involved in chromosome partitioning